MGAQVSAQRRNSALTMRHFKGKADADGGDKLDALLDEWLIVFDGRAAEVKQWLLTGTPHDLIATLPGARGRHLGSPQQRDAMVSALEDADPMIEWRLGSLLVAGTYNESLPLRVLHESWQIRGCCWPEDDRIEAMLSGAGVQAKDRLTDMLTVRRWNGDVDRKPLRLRPSFDRLLVEHSDIIRRLLGGDANQVERMATALTSASPEILGTFSDTIAGLLTNASKKRRRFDAGVPGWI